jgi:hypothetical protein
MTPMSKVTWMNTITTIVQIKIQFQTKRRLNARIQKEMGAKKLMVYLFFII